MSIIYDALQKTQQNRRVQNDDPETAEVVAVSRFDWKDMVLIFLIITLLLTTSTLMFFHHKRFFARPVVAVAPLPAPPVEIPLPKLVLNGIFMSDQEQFAMINNHPFHMGDVVEGMKIVDIGNNSVKLQNEHHSIILEVMAS